MSPFEFSLLADENIHPDVISFLKQTGHNILSISDINLTGQKDPNVLQYSHDYHRVILTHDSDFGKIAVAEEKPFIGMIYLRPGHIKPEFTIETLKVIKNQSISVKEKIILVSERIANTVKIRIRQL